MTTGALVLDRDRFAVTIGGRPVPLTRREYLLVAYLMEKPGFVRSRDQIMTAVHGPTIFVDEKTIDTLVRRVRRKLDPFGVSPIKTRNGFGYAWAEPGAGLPTSGLAVTGLPRRLAFDYSGR